MCEEILFYQKGLRTLLFFALYGGTLCADNKNNPPNSWNEQSNWVYKTLSSKFFKHTDNYENAISEISGIAEKSGQYQAFSYTYDLALSLMDEGQIKEIATNWVKKYPQDSQARIALIQAYLINNDEAGAYEEILKILKAESGDKKKEINNEHIEKIAKMLGELADNKGRISMLQRLALEYPNNFYILYYLGLYAREQGLIDIAIKSFEQALILNNDFKQVEFLLAKSLAEIGSLKEARLIMLKLREQFPDDKNLIAAEIDMLVSFNQWDAALELLKAWQKIAPDDFELKELSAWLYMSSGKDKEAELAYASLLFLGEIEEEQYSQNIASAAMKAKNYSKALDELAKIPQNSSFYRPAQEEIALIFFKQEKIDKAQKSFALLRKNFPDYEIESYMVEISQLDRLNKFAEAQKLIEEALAKYPQQIELLLTQAEHLFLMGKTGEAEKVYQEIIKLDPDNADALNSYGYLLLTQTGRHDEAADLIRKAIAKYPQLPAIQDSYAWLLFKEGNLTEALNWIERAYSSYKKDEITAHYLEILVANGKKNLAAEIFNYALKSDKTMPQTIATGVKLEIKIR